MISSPQSMHCRSYVSSDVVDVSPGVPKDALKTDAEEEVAEGVGVTTDCDVDEEEEVIVLEGWGWGSLLSKRHRCITKCFICRGGCCDVILWRY